MDDWNDFGPDSRSSTGRSAFYTSWRQDSDGHTSSASFPSWRSASAAEPRSVMLRQLPQPPPPPPQNNHTPNAPEPPKRGSTDAVVLGPAGDLDAATDCEELGVTRSGRHYNTFKTSKRYHSVSYTKLEVISAQQIQQLLHAFHIVIASAVCWTIFSAILFNRSVANTKIGVRPSLLSDAQKDWVLEHVLPDLLRPLDTNYRDHKPLRLKSPVVRTYTSDLVTDEVKRFFCRFRRQGACPYDGGFVQCDIPDVTDVSDPCYRYWSTSTLKAVTRQLEGPGGAANNTGASVEPLRYPWQVDPKGNRKFMYPVRTVLVPRWYRIMCAGLMLFFAFFTIAIGVLFLIRLARCGRRNISQEQMFTCGFLFIAMVYFNVILSTMNFNRALAGQFFPDWMNMLQKPMIALRSFALSPMLLFFVWANIHSYRILDPLAKLGPEFFIPKILVLAPYAVFKVFVFVQWKISTSESMFISAVLAQHAFGRFNFVKAYPTIFAVTVTLTLYEALLLGLIIYQTAVTMKALRRAPYMRHRSKHTGFRFFIYINFVFFLSYFFTQALIVIAEPSDGPLFDLSLFGHASLQVSQSHTVGSIFLLAGYLIILAHVNLPYDSVGTVKGWVTGSELAPSSIRWSSASSSDSSGLDSDSGSGSGSVSGTHSASGYSRTETRALIDTNKPRFIVDKDYELNQEIVEPVTYRKRESDSSLELKANCFTMQTHVFMFNFAWYVYYYGTPKFERLKEQDQVLPFQFKVAESIREESTDTQALIIDGDDRIIVSFKGSTSLRNLRTSLAVYHERLKNVVPTNIDGEDEHERLADLFQGYYEAAKIHKGFAMAYASVAHRVMGGIKRLHDEKPRPIFLTGHSLGGALATICSLDIWVKLRISRRAIFVSTFGSPRVGNEAFKRVYNSVIVLHWRIVVDPDMVAKLPKGMFRHVGKKVTLTQHGDLFIDPSALELKLWSGSTAGFAYHRKASYLLAMQAWCLRHHKLTYTPEFWEFPVRDEDRERFVGARFEEANEDLEAPHMKAVKKIILLDAMVDSLNNESDNTPVGNIAAVEKWARLTRRLLLREKLTSAVNRSGNLGVL